MFTIGKKMSAAVMAFTFLLAIGVNAQENATAEANSTVSRQRAQQIALQRIAGGKVVDSEFNDRWFRDDDYEFTVVDAANRYDVTVDAKTGEVTNVKQHAIYEDSLSDADRERIAGSNPVTPERARAIAMERAPNATIVGMDREMNNGRIVYKVDMLGGDSRVDMTLDGVTGEILNYDGDRIEADANSIRLESRSFSRNVSTAAEKAVENTVR